jgi:DNA-binding SARP family transcriptional activator
VLELRRAAADGDLDAARALRERPLLPEHDADWVFDAREALRADLAEIAERHALLAEQAGDIDAAVAWSRERAACDPLSESAQTRLMRLLAMRGDRAAAVQVAAQLRQRLVDELGLVPSPATRATMDDLLLDDAPATATGHTCWRCAAQLAAAA